jgi:antitoxin HicB
VRPVPADECLCWLPHTVCKNRMATLLKTSRTQVDRLLDAKDDITLSSLQRAAAIVGRRVTLELV